MTGDRGYQSNFYRDHPGIQDIPRRQRKAKKIRTLLQKIRGIQLDESRCLDIGCSSAVVTQELAPLFRSIIGIEFDYEALTQAPVQRPFDGGISLLNGDAMTLPFADHSFDVILCAQVYEHVPDDTQLASEMYRVLRPGGVVFFSGPNQSFPYEFHYNLPFLHWLPGNLANKVLRALGKGDFFYERFRTQKGLRKLFSAFSIEDVTPDVIQFSLKLDPKKRFEKAVGAVLGMIVKPFLFLAPNFNWFLYKSSRQ